MAEQVINITDLASQGVVLDTPPVSLAPNVFTSARNVRFKDGAIRKMTGELLLNNVVSDLIPANEEFGKIRYLAYWPNPNLAPLGCYYIFVVDYVRDGITIGQKIYIQDHIGNKKDITPSHFPDGLSFTTSGWQHTLFAGGFAFVINNGIDHPHYILDASGNTDINNIVLADLPGWDSYNVQQKVITDTWRTGDSQLFDLGQKVDFTLNSVSLTIAGGTSIVEAGTPAGTGVPNSSSFIPGILPTPLPSVSTNKFQIYTDSNTNTTVIYAGGLSDGDVVDVTISSRNLVHVVAGVIRSFGDLLVAGDLTEYDSVSGDIVRRLSGVVRTSDVAAPGSIPNNWDPFSAGVSTADEFTLSETNVIEDMASLQGNLYIYSTDSIHVMRLTGNTAAPVSFAPVTDEYGCLSTNAVVEYDGKHLAIGSNDIYQFAGHPGTIQSLADGRVRTYLFDNLNPIHAQQIFTILNHQENEIWICFPTLSSLTGECNEALIYNYRDNTWTIRDLNNVTSGDLAVIKGGGIPTATVTITGDSGNAGYSNTGKREVQTITVNGATPKVHIGTKPIKEIDVTSFTPFTTDNPEVIDILVTGDTGPNTINAVNDITFPNALTFTFDKNQTTYPDGGATVTLVGDATIGSVTISAISVLSAYNNGDTITMPQLIGGIRDYINANQTLADSTATAAGDVLTLTSDVPGPRAFVSGTINISGSGITNLTFNTTTVGIGVYGISAANSPSIRMAVTAPAQAGVHAAINETITLTKNLTSTTDIRDDIITQLSALSVFDGSATAIYGVAASGNNVRLTSIDGADHSAITIGFDTEFLGTTYLETEFGGNLTDTVTVVTQGVDRGIPDITVTVTFPDSTTSQFVLSGTYDNVALATLLKAEVDAPGDWTTSLATATLTATYDTRTPLPTNFNVSLSSSGSLPAGFSNATFVSSETRPGLDPATTTDRITLTPPTGYGSAITVDFDDTATWPAYDVDTPGSIAAVTAIQIATTLEAAWTDTTYWTVSRNGADLEFTSVNREAIANEFVYTIVNGTTRLGTAVTPLITDSGVGDITVIDGVDPIYSGLTRATITLSTPAGASIIFDRHYGEGPGRLLDPNFTPALNDLTYGDTGETTDAGYLNLYYDPDKDLARTNTTEQAKPNGTVADMQDMLLDILSVISNTQQLTIVPDSTSVPTTIDISPSQFSSTANYVQTLSPYTGDTSQVAPTTATLLASAEGATVATTNPTYDTTGTVISTTFDIERPWSSTKVNPNKTFPIFAESFYDNAGVLSNAIHAGDIGYTFSGTPYISFIERQQISINPDFRTDGLDTMSLWADGGTAITVGGVLQRATLQIRSRCTNYPGEEPYLITPEDNTQTDARANKFVTNSFTVASDYKVDLRLFGRFLNYRIDDAANSLASGYTGSNIRGWNISGLQLGVSTGGSR
jgi:hypothetical protein